MGYMHNRDRPQPIAAAAFNALERSEELKR